MERLLRIIIATWEGEEKSFSGNMMNGVARLIWAYGDSLNDEIFKNKLSQISVREIIRTAKERRAGSLGYAEAMLNAYNRRLKAGLKWSLLHSSKGGQAKRMELTEPKEPDTDTGNDTDM